MDYKILPGEESLLWHAQCSAQDMGDQKSAGSGIRAYVHTQIASTYMPVGPAMATLSWAIITISLSTVLGGHLYLL